MKKLGVYWKRWIKGDGSLGRGYLYGRIGEYKQWCEQINVNQLNVFL